MPNNGIAVIVEYQDDWLRTTIRLFACRFAGKWWNIDKNKPLKETLRVKVTKYWHLDATNAVTV